MQFLTRTALAGATLAAFFSVASAQTTDQDHQAHHPDPTAASAAGTSPAPAPAQSPQDARPGTMAPGGMPMMGMMGQGGMMMSPEQMRAMMQGMMGRQPGMESMGGMGSMGSIMGMPFEYVEGRIAFLKAEFGITDAQAGPWNAFAEALRKNANAMRSVHEELTKSGIPSAWIGRLGAQEKLLTTRLDAVKALKAASEPLFAAFTEEQRKMADRLLTGPMGMTLGAPGRM